jgi:hypothetical protein
MRGSHELRTSILNLPIAFPPSTHAAIGNPLARSAEHRLENSEPSQKLAKGALAPAQLAGPSF